MSPYGQVPQGHARTRIDRERTRKATIKKAHGQWIDASACVSLPLCLCVYAYVCVCVRARAWHGAPSLFKGSDVSVRRQLVRSDRARNRAGSRSLGQLSATDGTYWWRWSIGGYETTNQLLDRLSVADLLMWLGFLVVIEGLLTSLAAKLSILLSYNQWLLVSLIWNVILSIISWYLIIWNISPLIVVYLEKNY